MDAVYVGWLSILPPMIAIILALITKEVLFSLIAGVLSGTLIYSIASGMNPIVGPVSTVFDVMIQKTDMNIIIFCFLLGGLVYLINASGGAQAYGKWASKIIRTKRSSLLLTSLLGCLIFLDDYFNCLTVGTVCSDESIISHRMILNRYSLFCVYQCYHSNIKRSIHYRYVHPLFRDPIVNKFLF